MDDLSAETRELLEEARQGERVPWGPRRAMRRRLAVALGVSTSMGIGASASGGTALWMVAARTVGTVGLLAAAGGSAAMAVHHHAQTFAGVPAARSVVVVRDTGPVPLRGARGGDVQSLPADALSATAADDRPLATENASASDESAKPAPEMPFRPIPSIEAQAPPALRGATSRTAAPSALQAPPVLGGPRVAAAPPLPVLPPSSIAEAAGPWPKPIDDPLAAEARLIGDAQRALVVGNGALALGLLDQHQASFLTGSLAPERAALRVEALCAVGRVAEARAEAASFHAHYPRSPLQGRWSRPCVDMASGDRIR